MDTAQKRTTVHPTATATGIDGMLADRMATGGGALCNDQSGLCIGSRGDIDATRSGVYTSIARLASQLDSGVEPGGEIPLVSIQTDQAALLVKEYDGHAVVIRVPAAADVEEKGIVQGPEDIIAEQRRHVEEDVLQGSESVE